MAHPFANADDVAGGQAAAVGAEGEAAGGGLGLRGSGQVRPVGGVVQDQARAGPLGGGRLVRFGQTPAVGGDAQPSSPGQAGLDPFNPLLRQAVQLPDLAWLRGGRLWLTPPWNSDDVAAWLARTESLDVTEVVLKLSSWRWSLRRTATSFERA